MLRKGINNMAKYLIDARHYEETAYNIGALMWK